MLYRKLDADGDYTLGSGGDFLKNTPEAVGQAIGTRLKLWRGEWFVDITDGTPWNEQVLGKLGARSGRHPDAAIKQRILGTFGVTEITAYNSTFNGETRQLTVAATVNTIYGQTMIKEVL